ncbi:MAG: 6,7-dimethyl-8-ribityllumazine synthase [Longimicrobiales bacterium]
MTQAPKVKRIALIVARFNSLITEQLLTGAQKAVGAHGDPECDSEVFYVPGAWELPQAAAWIVGSGRFDAIVALGCVIRGETSHYDFVAGGASDGLGAVARAADIPVIFGVLTTENPEQALERADVHGADKGGEVVRAAIEMMGLHDSI